MARKLIVVKRNLLHCDECHHEVDAGEIGEHLIGYECPRCGADMLTEQEYRNGVQVLAVVDWLNKWFGWLGGDPDDPDRPPGQKFSVSAHDDSLTFSKGH